MSGSDWHTRKQRVYNWPSNKNDLRPHHDKLARSRPSYAIHKPFDINSNPGNNHGPIAVIHLRPTSDGLVTPCDRLATNPRPGSDRLGLSVWLSMRTFAFEKNFKSDLRMIYDRAEWHTRSWHELRPTCKDLRPKEGPVASLDIWKSHWQVPRPFLMVKSGHGACRFQWRVNPSYCGYSGVPYDHLVINIGGTCHLADQLPSNREYDQCLVISQSQVPPEFDVTLV